MVVEALTFERLVDAAAERLARGERLLLWGPPGAGKTTLGVLLARRLATEGVICLGIAADPGSPGFGAPGALCLGVWGEERWRLQRLAALCTLDAARFRLPLVQALRRLASAVAAGPLLIDAPGVVRGTPGAELLQAMAEAARVDAVVALVPQAGSEAEAAGRALASLGTPVLLAPPAPEARHRGKAERARARTELWDCFLSGGAAMHIEPGSLPLRGVPSGPGLRWPGRQVALLDHSGETLGLGEVTTVNGDALILRLGLAPEPNAEPASLLARDAARLDGGLLGSLRGTPPRGPAPGLPPEMVVLAGEGADPALFTHLGTLSALIPGGLFGDPLVHLRLRQRARSLFLDLGDSGRLPARIAHQVTDVFLSHAHMDHIAGFLWFLRSRIGVTETCRLFGPPGIAGHLAGFIAGVCWDRIGDTGPRFEIGELHGDRLRRSRIQVGHPLEPAGEVEAPRGLVREEPDFSVRAVTLDHGIPVLAWRLDTAPGVHMLPERLRAAGLREGPWVGELKRRLLAGEDQAQVAMPGGSRRVAAELAHLVERRPARSLVYATDLADTGENRRRLVELARGADVLICEAGFAAADAAQARRTGHLTARACGEIAASAGARRLVPFHLSRRYERDASPVYDEVEAAFGAWVERAGGVRSAGEG
jgi:ribonuclease Z